MRALILAGGSGTRFWPLSRGLRPKQLLALDGESSLLAVTVRRLEPLVPIESVWICTTERLTEAVAADVPEIAAERVLGEPVGRNTAPAIAWALDRMGGDPEEPVAVLPADHRVEDEPAFRSVLEDAARAAAENDVIMTLGVRPRWAETGYGYLEVGEALTEEGGPRRVARFTEKPDLETARAFVASGNYLWNAGMFVFQPATLRRELRVHLAELADGLQSIQREPNRTVELYPQLPAISIDHGIMEKVESIATLPLDCGWSDLGSWQALYEVLADEQADNVQRGEVLGIDSSDNLLYADEGSIVTLGIEGLVVVRTADTVLVVPRERSQEVRRLVDALRQRGRDDLL